MVELEFWNVRQMYGPSKDSTSAFEVKMKGSSQIFKNGKMEDVKKGFLGGQS